MPWSLASSYYAAPYALNYCQWDYMWQPGIAVYPWPPPGASGSSTLEVVPDQGDPPTHYVVAISNLSSEYTLNSLGEDLKEIDFPPKAMRKGQVPGSFLLLYEDETQAKTLKVALDNTTGDKPDELKGNGNLVSVQWIARREVRCELR